jgi:hypothetical protein
MLGRPDSFGGAVMFSRKLALLALVCVACGGDKAEVKPEPKLNRWGKPYKEGVVAPAWVDKIPERTKQRMFGVGFSSPSFWPQDAIDKAGQDARGKLALALASHIEVLGVDTATGRADNGGATINKEATDLVLQNSRIEATWVDENGDHSEPGSVWALGSYDLNSARAQPAAWTPGTAKIAPSWLDRLPGSNGKVYAAGYSGPTFKAEAAVQYAGESAIDNLASSLRAHVQAYTLLVENKSGLSVDQFSATDDPDQAFLDLVKQNAKIEATWVDKDSVRPGDPPGAVWALASIDVPSTQGGVQKIQNDDLGPALDKKGNLQPEPAPK